ncbi:uncharacterized, partial [Tachysurus ichikawai]
CKQIRLHPSRKREWECECWELLPDHPIHHKDVPEKSHDADDGVESSNGHSYYHPRCSFRGVLFSLVLSIRNEGCHIVRKGDIVRDDGVKVGNVSISSSGQLHYVMVALCDGRNASDLQTSSFLYGAEETTRNKTEKGK